MKFLRKVEGNSSRSLRAVSRYSGDEDAPAGTGRAREGQSALVRQLLEVTLRMSAKDRFPKLDALEKVSRDARLSVRLAPEDRILLCDRATARGMRSATYISVLVRSHLRNLAPLPKEELSALKRSVAELGAIGGDLNQIARAANQSTKPSGPGRGTYRQCSRSPRHFATT